MLKQLFRRRRARATELEKLLASAPCSREQHYRFAHYFLRSLVFSMGSSAVMVLLDPERGQEFVRRVWDVAGEDAPADELVPSEGLRIQIETTPREIVVLVHLPEPLGTNEAYFVAIVSPVLTDLVQKKQHEFVAKIKTLTIDYYTLEKGLDKQGQSRSVFGAWTAEGKHVNMGEGPQPTAEAFLDAIANRHMPIKPVAVRPSRLMAMNN